MAVSVVEDDKAAIKQRHRSHYDNKSVSPRSSSDSRPRKQTLLHNFENDNNSTPQGLPPLRFGTVRDPLPPDWHLTPYPTMGNFYGGNMSYMSPDANFFQAALPSDGCLDLVNIEGNISRWSAVKLLLAVGNGTFFDIPHVNYRKVAGYRVVPQDTYVRRGWRWVGYKKGLIGKGGPREKKEGFISIDGERVPFEPFQVEVHASLGTVLSRSGRWYEAPELV